MNEDEKMKQRMEDDKLARRLQDPTYDHFEMRELPRRCFDLFAYGSDRNSVN